MYDSTSIVEVAVNNYKSRYLPQGGSLHILHRFLNSSISLLADNIMSSSCSRYVDARRLADRLFMPLISLTRLNLMA